MVMVLIGMAGSHITEMRQLNAELAIRGWSRKDLARHAGLAYGTLKNVLCGRHTNWPARAKINEALGREIFTQSELKQKS